MTPYPHPHINLMHRRFGRLVTMHYTPGSRTHRTDARWMCQCDCGNTFFATTGSLRSGNARSCGCLRRARIPRQDYACHWCGTVRAMTSRQSLHHRTGDQAHYYCSALCVRTHRRALSQHGAQALSLPVTMHCPHCATLVPDCPKTRALAASKAMIPPCQACLALPDVLLPPSDEDVRTARLALRTPPSLLAAVVDRLTPADRAADRKALAALAPAWQAVRERHLRLLDEERRVWQALQDAWQPPTRLPRLPVMAALTQDPRHPT